MSEPTNTLIYQTLLDQNKEIGAIRATLDAVKTNQDGFSTSLKAHNGRIDKLEAAHNKMRGAAMVWSLLVSAVVSALGWYFGSSK